MELETGNWLTKEVAGPGLASGTRALHRPNKLFTAEERRQPALALAAQAVAR